MTALLLRPVADGMKRRIENFGIELEVLDSGDTDGREHYCDCEYCNFEPEPMSSRASIYLDAFSSLIYDDLDLHDYHCSCSSCDYHRSGPTMTAQRDCTVGIEFVSRILSAENDFSEVDAVVQAHEQAMRSTGWRPDGYESCGNHIHVSSQGTDNGGQQFRYTTRTQAQGLIESLFAVGNWDTVADGGCGRLRTYNGGKFTKPGHHRALDAGNTSWITSRSQTFEFRLWNTPSKADRIKAHVGLSLGITRWAYTQVIRDRDILSNSTFDRFVERIAECPDDVAEVILAAVPKAFRNEAADALSEWLWDS